jgi:hypothetical protein
MDSSVLARSRPTRKIAAPQQLTHGAIQPRVIVSPLDKDESGMGIDDGVSGTAHIEE